MATLDSPSSTLSAADIEQANAIAEHSKEVRIELDRVSKETPQSLIDLVTGPDGPWKTLPEFRRAKKEFDADECRFVLDGENIRIRHTGRTLKQLLGPGSEAILPSDDGEMPPERLAAALLIWARRRLRRSQTRNALVRHARAVSALARKLKQITSTMPKPPPAPMPEQRLVIFMGTTRLRFRMRGFLWAPGTVEPRIFDSRLFPVTTSDAELLKVRSGGSKPNPPALICDADVGMSAAVATMFAKVKKQPASVVNPEATRLADAIRLKKPTADGSYIALPPPPPPKQAGRGGIRNMALEGCTGLHEKTMAVKSANHLVDLRGKIRSVVLAMGASGDGGDDGPPAPIGACDVLDGIRWQRCAEIGKPLQEAWGYAVSERLFKLWIRLGVTKDGVPRPLWDREDARAPADRMGLPGLPGVWCPAKPRSAARCPGRVELRAWLGLLMEQKRIHCDELVRGYEHWARVAGVAHPSPEVFAIPPQEGEPLLKLHAKLVLKNLKYNRRANARWEVLIEKQLADEADGPCDPNVVAAELRRAQKKIVAFEEHLIEGLAEFSDARAALRMHLFNRSADPELPLAKQLSNRLAGTAFGELLGQRFEHLESPDFHPALLGAAAAFPPGWGGPVPAMPFLIPAAEAAEELAIDNVILGQWLAVLPALMRNGTGSKIWGGAVVGVPEAYDEALTGMLASMVVNPTTQLMLTFVAMARYAWAAMRKEAPPPPKTEEELAALAAKEAERQANATPADKAADAAREMLTPAQLNKIKKHMLPLRMRVAAATPKGCTPSDPSGILALKEEIAALEIDAQNLKEPMEEDVEQIRACLLALLDLIAASVRVLRHKALAVAPPPEGDDEVKAAAIKEEVARAATAQCMKKLKNYCGEALTQAVDMTAASNLDGPTVLSVVGEAVCDVSVEQSDLIRGVYKLLMKRTVAAIISSNKIVPGAPRTFLSSLVKRKPCVVVAEAEAVAWAMRTNKKGDVVGEVTAAQKWAKATVTKLEESRDGQRALLEWITFLTLDELRAVQGCLSNGKPPILLPDLVNAGVGGVSKLVLLAKLDKAMVADSDDPLRLNHVWTMLPGREGPSPAAGTPRAAPYAPKLVYAEGEEMLRGAAGADGGGALGDFWGRQLLDAGQRLAPDGSQFNVVRLHRIFAMQSAAADRAATLTLERMLDEFVTLHLRSGFFEKLGGGGDDDEGGEIVLKGKSEVLKYLLEKGFAELKAGGPEGKAKTGGCQFVQPCMLTPSGETRCLLGAGTRESCGSVADRTRVGEQLKWSPWGAVLSIVRVDKPLPSHFEWVSFLNVANFAGVKNLMASDIVYYVITHTLAPESSDSRRFAAAKFDGPEAVFDRLAGPEKSEISRQTGNVAIISPPFSGDKLKDLRARRQALLGASAEKIAWGQPKPFDATIEGEIEIAREAYSQCLNYGGDGEGPKRSVLHFAGRWLPLGEGSKRKGQLVVCVRETIGWKYLSKPSKDGNDKPSAARKIGMLCREFFVDKVLHEPAPAAPGFKPQWELWKMRGGASG